MDGFFIWYIHNHVVSSLESGTISHHRAIENAFLKGFFCFKIFKKPKNQKMKKIYLLAIAALATTAAFSQVKWGVQATGNLSTASLNAEFSEMFKKTAAIGFGAGVVSEATLSENLSLRTSLNLLPCTLLY